MNFSYFTGITAEEAFDNNSLIFISIQVNQQIIINLSETKIILSNTLAKDNLIAAGIIINCIQTITEVINVGIIISATV